MVIKDDNLSLLCHNDRMKVVKTSLGFKKCYEEDCGYGKWIDPPLKPLVIDANDELHDRRL